VNLIPLGLLLEKARLRRMAYRSGRREMLGLETRRDIIGFEKPGEKKIVAKRKRPKKPTSILFRSPLRATTSKSRIW